MRIFWMRCNRDDGADWLAGSIAVYWTDMSSFNYLSEMEVRRC